MNETLITLKLGRNGIRDEGVREQGQVPVVDSTLGALKRCTLTHALS